MTRCHKVETVKFYISFGSEDDAFAQQAEIDRMVKTMMLPVVEEVLDEYAEEGVVIRLDQLEVDLGAISLIDYPDKFVPRLRDELRSVLQGKIRRLKNSPAGGERLVPEQGTEVELLCFFLKYGILPWQGNISATELDSLMENVLVASPERLAQFLANSSNNTIVLERLIRQSRRAHIVSLVQFLAVKQTGFNAAMAEQISRGLQDVSVSRTYLKAIIKSLLANKATLTATRLLEGMKSDPGEILDDSLVVKVHSATAEEILRAEQLLELAFRHGEIAGIKPHWSSWLQVLPAVVEKTLRRCGAKQASRRAIAASFSDEWLSDCVMLLEPQEGHFVAAVVNQADLFTRTSGQRSSRAADVKNQLWEFSLAYLLVERGSEFNRKMYLGSLLQKTAARRSQKYEDLLEALHALLATADGGSGLKSGLMTVLKELGADSTGKARPQHKTQSDEGYRVFRYLLDYGAPPHGYGRNITVLIEQIVQTNPAVIGRILQDLKSGKIHSGMLIGTLSAELLENLVHRLIEYSSSSGSNVGRKFLNAIVSGGKKATNKKHYYGRLLRCLADDQVIDFEDLLIDPPVSATMRLKPVDTATKEGTSPDTLLLKRLLRSRQELTINQQVQLLTEVESLLKGQPSTLYKLLVPMLQEEMCRARLIALLPDSVMTSLLSSQGEPASADLKRAEETAGRICDSLGNGSNFATIRHLKWDFLLCLWASVVPLKSAIPVAERFTACLELSGITEHNLAPPLQDAVTATLVDHFSSKSPQQPDLLTNTTPQTQARVDVAANATSAEEDAALGAIYIANAGAVIASAYLPRLFTLCRLLDTNAFIDRPAAEKAIHLLQFLVDGRTDAPEFQLVLNKILCGVKTETPIARSVELSVTEQQAAQGLLQGMLQNWKGIGNTSVGGLQEAFLQRDGCLSLKDDAWHLQVEQKTYDMLLDTLPWGISPIKHPWMERVLYVEWR